MKKSYILRKLSELKNKCGHENKVSQYSKKQQNR